MSETQIIQTQIYVGGEGNPIVWFLKGLPASGKSGWSASHVNEFIIRLNKDDFRLMMGAKFSDNKEKAVLAGLRAAGVSALESGLSIIVDDTNFSSKHKNFWESLAKQKNYNMIEVYFDTPVDVCIERDMTRGSKMVGSKVITEMYHKFINTEELNSVVKYRVQDTSLPLAIIVDIDGTLAFMNGRNPYDDTKVDTDLPNRPVVELVAQLGGKYHTILIVSGRQEKCREATELWLKNTIPCHFELFMRSTNDFRKDSTVKKELFDRYIKDKYHIDFVLDDRNQVVDMWRTELNLPCFQVNYGNF
jgi:predicted kinase